MKKSESPTTEDYLRELEKSGLPTPDLPLWAYVVMVIYFALCGFGLTKGIAV